MRGSIAEALGTIPGALTVRFWYTVEPYQVSQVYLTWCAYCPPIVVQVPISATLIFRSVLLGPESLPQAGQSLDQPSQAVKILLPLLPAPGFCIIVVAALPDFL